MRHRQPRFFVLLLLLFLVACRESPVDPAASPSSEEELRARTFVWTSAEPRSIDPTFIADTPGAAVALNLFEGLYVVAPGDEKPRFGLTATQAVSADGLVYRFELRDDAMWSDGRPVTAGDFVYAWRRMLAPESGAPGAEDLWRLKGAKAYHTGENPNATSVGVKAEGPHTLVVELERPDPFFAEALASSRFLPVPAHVVDVRGERWIRPEHMVTNGPFVLQEWAPRQRLVFTRSESWWNRKDVALERAELRVVEREELAVRLYEDGEVDYTPGQVPFETILRYRKQGRADLRLDPYSSVAYLAFNQKKSPFDDRRVRAAFSRAIDRRGLIAAVLRGGQTPATHLLPESYRGLIGYEGPRGDGYDPKAASRLLAKAGYPGGAGFPKVELACNASDVLGRMMTYVKRDLERHLGVQIDVVQSEWKSFLAAVQQGDFQLARFAMQGSLDPVDLLSVFRSGGHNNIGGYDSPVFDSLLDRIRAEGERAARLRLVAQAEQQLNDDVALLPLYFYTRPALLSPSVKGFEAQSQDLHLLRYLSKP